MQLDKVDEKDKFPESYNSPRFIQEGILRQYSNLYKKEYKTI